MGFIKELHLFTQMFWLEKVFPRMAGADFMQGMEKIKITIRRGDWWEWEHNKPLGISPQGGHGDSQRMYHEWAVEKSGKDVPWQEDSWGSAFKKMRNLKSLVLEMETEDAKLDELKDILAHAKSWHFPAWSSQDGPGMVLGGIVDETVWSRFDAPPCNWSSPCPTCGVEPRCVLVNRKPACVERVRRKKEDIGPLCHMAALTWRISRKEDVTSIHLSGKEDGA